MKREEGRKVNYAATSMPDAKSVASGLRGDNTLYEPDLEEPKGANSHRSSVYFGCFSMEGELPSPRRGLTVRTDWRRTKSTMTHIQAGQRARSIDAMS